ncbi:MAG: aldo/keto reductase [Chloroflexi bacterium]|nr:aldo/keto reductase [Chloroflexota bacterium]
MQYRKLGNTDVELSVVGFGVWTVSAGWWGEFSDDEAANLLRRALDLGITFFDTGDTYGNGRGETLLAQAFEGRRHEVVIGTKFGYDFYTDPEANRGQRERPHNWTPEFVRFALEQSLRRLGTDYVDLYQLHNPRMDAIRRDDLFELLERLRDEGKIRAYGAALGPAIGGTEHGDEALAERRLDALQIIFNLLEQDPGRRFFPLARERGVGVLVRVPHSSGMLEGQYTPETTFPASDHRSHRPREWLIEGLRKIEHLRFLHEGRDMTLGQAALKWVLAELSVTSAQPNIYNQDQLEEFAAAPDKPDLTPDDLDRVAELYARNFDLVESEIPA